MAPVEVAAIELSAGGVIYRRRAGGELEVLLIKDSYGKWGFPKGHLEAGESAEDAALRECREETGLARLRAVEALGTSDWYFRFGETLVHKFCDYFLLASEPADVARPQRGEGIQACVWLSPSEAAARISYANARKVLEAALDRLRASPAQRPAPRSLRPRDRPRRGK